MVFRRQGGSPRVCPGTADAFEHLCRNTEPGRSCFSDKNKIKPHHVRASSAVQFPAPTGSTSYRRSSLSPSLPSSLSVCLSLRGSLTATNTSPWIEIKLVRSRNFLQHCQSHQHCSQNAAPDSERFVMTPAESVRCARQLDLDSSGSRAH